MKKRSKLIIGLSLILVFVAVIAIVAVVSKMQNQPIVIKVGNSNGVSDDRIQLTIEECFERSDLVVRGKYRGVVDGFPIIFDGKPLQFQELEVEEVYKGDCGDTLVYANVGGEVNVRDYVEAAAREGVLAEKVGPPLLTLDYLREDYPDLNVVYRCDDDFPFVPELDQEYLLLLRWQPFGDVRGAYYPLNAFWGKECILGMRKINEDGLVLNPYTNNYETVYFMQENEE